NYDVKQAIVDQGIRCEHHAAAGEPPIRDHQQIALDVDFGTLRPHDDRPGFVMRQRANRGAGKSSAAVYPCGQASSPAVDQPRDVSTEAESCDVDKESGGRASESVHAMNEAGVDLSRFAAGDCLDGILDAAGARVVSGYALPRGKAGTWRR